MIQMKNAETSFKANCIESRLGFKPGNKPAAIRDRSFDEPRYDQRVVTNAPARGPSLDASGLESGFGGYLRSKPQLLPAGVEPIPAARHPMNALPVSQFQDGAVSRYPTPGSVRMNSGRAGSYSSFSRRCAA